MIYKLKVKRWPDDTLSIIEKEETSYSLKPEIDPMPFVCVSNDYKINIKEPNKLNNHYVSYVDDFNQLPEDIREFILRSRK